MTSRDDAPARPRKGLEEKRCAIVDGAFAVFARDGYTRASIDAIAREAEVSTRTIYNHFRDKADLFRTVIQESATRIADAQVEAVERHLDKDVGAEGLEAALVAFALDWVRPRPDWAAHNALVRQINADAGHIPEDAIRAWQEAGPVRVRRAFAERLRDYADRGLLRVEDPMRASLHFALLTSVTNPSYRVPVPTDEELTEAVVTGVHTFLHGFAA